MQSTRANASPTLEGAYTVPMSSQAFLVNTDTGQPLPWNPSTHVEQSTAAPPELPVFNTGGVRVSRVADALQRLREMEGLHLNWDSYGSEPPRERALAAARDLIWRVYQGSAYTGRPSVPYAVVPLSGGGVQLEWRGFTDAIEVEISEEGVLGCLLVRGAGPTRQFEEKDAVPESRIVELALSII